VNFLFQEYLISNKQQQQHKMDEEYDAIVLGTGLKVFVYVSFDFLI
jgi:hypothetical protein